MCEFYGVFADVGPRAYKCVAPSCESHTYEPVCTSNGVSYDNECEYECFIFNTRRTDIVIHHRGRCQGKTSESQSSYRSSVLDFPFQRGNAQLKSSRSFATFACRTVYFNSNLFYPDKNIHGLASADFSSASDSTFVHDVPTIWIDELTRENMTVCVSIAGRGERHAIDQVSFTWFVYQGAPDGAIGGVVDLDETWLTEATCKQVDLAMTFDSPPIILATLRHSVPGVRRDAATLWAKDVRTRSFSLCVKELQSFDGAHRNVSIVRRMCGFDC